MSDCVAFLRSVLPELGLRWEGFRRVHRQVCKRIRRRMRDLGVGDYDAYRLYLETQPAEWRALARLCHVTISRFYRDRGVFDALSSQVLPVLARNASTHADRVLRVWSAGCGAGEEVYTTALVWRFRVEPRFPELALSLLGTDVDAGQIARARVGCYRASSLRELPNDWVRAAFEGHGDHFCIDAAARSSVELHLEDLREHMPVGRFDLVLCRNNAFTYFAEPVQRDVLQRMAERLSPGGALVLGGHERLPDGAGGFAPWDGVAPIYRRI